MVSKSNEEFHSALQDISYAALRFQSPYDRVRCCEWARKLASMPVDDPESSKIRNDYIQYLRIFVNSASIGLPFSHPPPDGELPPFGEYLGREMRKHIPEMPQTGPIAPAVMHCSPDGKAYISTKKLPTGGLFCYMAVTPDSF